MYFVTVCTQKNTRLFGKIFNGQMEPNESGRMVLDTWYELSNRFTDIRLDTCVVMPNHFHGIIHHVGATLVVAQNTMGAILLKRAGTRPAPTLGHIIGAFKSMTTKKYIVGVHDNAWTPFIGKLWQRDYYEHVIRSEKSLNNIREYIVNNPAHWDSDEYHPKQFVSR